MKSDMPFLSILIPTRNRAYYLRYAIQSALNVSFSNIEIIVSENYGSDNGWEVANSFTDPRLIAVRPDKPLPMHENWEFLLSKARGRWITFIGDDDAVMPHCAEYLSYLDTRYPESEAIVSPRAYYDWEHAYRPPNDKPRCIFSFAHYETWQDSKQALRLCLNDKKEYIYLPQIYSGGFQRRSLVQRVIRLQGGHYFRSVTPDAYSAVVVTLHTYRYLEVGVPMTWVGTSTNTKVISASKDRAKDFAGMHSDDFLMHPSLGKEYESWPFLIHFFEAYLAAAPFSDLSQLSWAHIRKIYRLSAKRLFRIGNIQGATDLAFSLGVKPVSPYFFAYQRIKYHLKRLFRLELKTCGNFRQRLPAKVAYNLGLPPTFCYSYRASGSDCPNILASDAVVAHAYSEYQALHKLSSLI